MPVFNTEQYLDRCINSILNQTYSNLQIIIVNDASPGNAVEIIQHYQAVDNRIIYIEHKKTSVFSKPESPARKLQRANISHLLTVMIIGIDYYRLLLEEAENQADMVFSRTVIVGQENSIWNA